MPHTPPPLSAPYWLVWLHPGSSYQIIRSDRQPRAPGGYVTQIGKRGDTLQILLRNLENAIINAPTGFDIPPAGTVTIPGYGTGGLSGGVTQESGLGGVYNTLADAIGGVTDFLKFISWIFHPINLLRATEFLTGLAFIFYGLNVLTKGMFRSRATHRTSIVRDVMSLFRKVPLPRGGGGEDHIAAGRAAGTRQGQRDVAYREARREVLRGSSNPPIEKRVRQAASQNGNQ